MDRVTSVRRPVVDTVGERLTALEREGYRATPQRRAILETMLSAGRENVTAEELCRRARAVCPTVNLATTYRTLDLLGRLGMVRRLTYGAFIVVGHRIEFYGYCAACRSAAPALQS